MTPGLVLSFVFPKELCDFFKKYKSSSFLPGFSIPSSFFGVLSSFLVFSCLFPGHALLVTHPAVPILGSLCMGAGHHHAGLLLIILDTRR